MELLRVQWASLGLLFLVIEMMILSLDFLALGVAALITAMLLAIFPDALTTAIWIPSAIFLGVSIINILITRLLILPRLQLKHKPTALSIDSLIGQHLIVQRQNDMDVVFWEGKYRPIQSQDDKPLSIGHKVRVQEIQGNLLIVK